MGSITIRNLDDRVKTELKRRAAEHGHSMEAEARAILRAAVKEKPSKLLRTGADLYAAIRRRVEPLGGIELSEMPPDYDIEVPKFK